MKIIYLDDDRSKLCDQQIPTGYLDRGDRTEFAPKTGGRCLKINPDGLSMAIGDRHGNIRIVHLESFEQIALLEAHESEVLSVDYSPPSHTGLSSPPLINRPVILPAFRGDIPSLEQSGSFHSCLRCEQRLSVNRHAR